jgi:dihydropteroate synthase
MRLQLREHELSVEAGEPLVMGILNIGHDSVADDTVLRDTAARMARGRELAAAGAHIIDIGVLSGRTDTAPIPVQDEIGLLAPVVGGLASAGIMVSVDTWRAPVIAAALDAGAAMINDTSGLADLEVAQLAAGSGAALVIMHTRAHPKHAFFPTYDDPVADVVEFLRERIVSAHEAGVGDAQIVIDPGLDYAKSPEASVEVLRRLGELGPLGRPILLAVSRKYFIGMLTGREPTDRLAGTIAAVDFGVRQGAHILRVHDVAEIADFLRLRFALHGDGSPEMRGSTDDERLKWIPPKAPAAEAAGRARLPPRIWLSDQIAYLADMPLEAGAAFVSADDRCFPIHRMMRTLRQLSEMGESSRPSDIVRCCLAEQGLGTEAQLQQVEAALDEMDAAWGRIPQPLE